MSRVNNTVEVTSEERGVYHIPGVHNMQQTLCGYVDCFGVERHDAKDHPCNCRGCIDALNDIKAMRFPKHYFTSTAAQAANKDTAEAKPLTRCAAARDGDCTNAQCPQLRDGEPAKTGRHCPLETHTDED